MKCRYNHCKLGGEVEKDIAIKEGNRYFHKECYEKYKTKQMINVLFRDKGMYLKDINIALKRAVDDIGYNIRYVYYVATEKNRLISDPYKLLYQLKIEDNYKEYLNKYKTKEQIKINYAIKNSDIKDSPMDFTIKPSKNKRLQIY